MRFLLSVLLLWFPFNSFSWGKEGRHLTVTIARGLLSEEVIRMVDYYLGTASWTEASDWIEKTNTPQNMASRGHWHRVLVAKDKTYVTTKSPDLLNQIEYQLLVLEKRSLFPVSSVADAIKTLFALLPEAHQPFRCGYTEDQGGSAVPVMLKGKKTTLLRLWDDEVLAQRPIDMWDFSKLIMTMPSKTKAEIQAAPPRTWVAESRALLKDAYPADSDNGNITDAYLDRSAAVARQQLLKAGVRLAAILNKHFKG